MFNNYRAGTWLSLQTFQDIRGQSRLLASKLRIQSRAPDPRIPVVEKGVLKGGGAAAGKAVATAGGRVPGS